MIESIGIVYFGVGNLELADFQQIESKKGQ